MYSAHETWADLHSNNGYGKTDYRSGFLNLKFTKEEVVATGKMLKPKLCTGLDLLSIKLIKDFTMTFPDMTTTLLLGTMLYGITN